MAKLNRSSNMMCVLVCVVIKDCFSYPQDISQALNLGFLRVVGCIVFCGRKKARWLERAS